MITCPQWSEHPTRPATHGRCARRRYGGEPEQQMCRQCMSRYPDGDAPPPLPPQMVPEGFNAATGWRLDSNGNAGCGCAEWRGLGDGVAEVLRRLRIDRLWHRILTDTAPARWPWAADQADPAACTCVERQESLNRLMSFGGGADRPAIKG